jgi:hypothetical protein
VSSAGMSRTMGVLHLNHANLKTMMWSFDFHNARNFVGFYAPLRPGMVTIEGLAPIVDVCGARTEFDPTN